MTFPDSNPTVADAVRKVLDTSLNTSVHENSIEVLQIRPDRCVAVCDRQYVVKLASGTDATRLQRSAHWLRLCWEHGLQIVPRLVAAGVLPDGIAFQISSWIDGQEWSAAEDHLTEPELREIEFSFGSVVSQLHSICPDGDEPASEPYLDCLRRRADELVVGADCRALMQRALTERADLFLDRVPKCLVHDDLHGHNVLLIEDGQGWSISGLLDFDKAWAGSQESDLARLEMWGRASGHFWEAYRAKGEVPLGYEDRRPVYQLLWCLEYGRGTDRHLRDTARVCESLQLPPITSFN